MNDKIRKHVAAYCERHDWPADEDSLIETITGARKVDSRQEGEFRWWTEYRYVVEIDGMFIAYFDARSSGDMSAQERGYEFDPSYIHEVEPVEKVITVYECVEEEGE